jgi:hypothetical protein
MVGGTMRRISGWGTPTADWVITDSTFENLYGNGQAGWLTWNYIYSPGANFGYHIGLAEGDILERNVFDGMTGWSWRIVAANAVIRNNVFVNTDPLYPPVQIATNDAATVQYNSFLDVNEVAFALVSISPNNGNVGANLVATENYFGTTDANKVQLALFDRTDSTGYASYILPNPILAAPHPDTPPAP